MPIMGNLTTTHLSRMTRRRASGPDAASTGLADALFTTTQQRLLALLFGQPGRSFFASELIQLTGSGSGAVQRELKRFASSGLVSVSPVGRQKHYQANPDCPVFGEMCGIVRKTLALAEPIRRALEPLADRIELALVYGSVVQGIETADSDVDLLLVADGVMLEELYEALSPVETGLARRISPTLYTSREFEERRTAGNPFLTNVLAGEHVILIGSEDGAPATR